MMGNGIELSAEGAQSNSQGWSAKRVTLEDSKRDVKP
jgi:hypothetical protein